MSRKFIYIIIIAILLFAGCSSDGEIESDNTGTSSRSEIEMLANLNEPLADDISEEEFEQCRQAASLAETLGYDDLLLQCLIRLFQIHNSKERYREAIQSGNEALEVAKNLNDENAQAFIYKLFGVNYYHLSSYHQAFDNLETSASMYKALNDTIGVLDVLNMQGNVFFNWGDIEQAYNYYSQNLELGKRINDNSRIATALTNMGITLVNRTDIPPDSLKIIQQKAIDHLTGALVYIQKDDNDIRQAEILNNLAHLYLQNEQVEKSLQASKQAQNIAKGRSSRIYIASCITEANTLVKTGQTNAADSLATALIPLAEERELRTQVIELLNIRAEAAVNNNDWEKAYADMAKANQLSDSIFNYDYKKKIDAIKIAGEMERIEQEQEMKQKQANIRSYFAISMLVALLIIILLLYSRVRTRAKNITLENHLLNERLETRNKELTTRIMALIQRNELEKDIMQQLNMLRPNIKRENQQDYDNIVRSLTFKQDDSLWKEFEVRFESVHQDFFHKLSTLYPDLTSNEKRLCAFLYLDMSSKEISAITGQSPRALNVARTRLRKKFDITNDNQSLSSFLSNINY